MTDLRGTRWGALCITLFGLFFFLAGGAIILQAVGVLSLAEDGLYVPRWVLGFAGGTFLMPGIGVLVLGIRGFVTPSALEKSASAPILTGLMVSMVLTCFAVTLAGVAFYGDAAGYRGGLTGAAIEGRIAFALAAVVVGLFAFVFWTLTLASLASILSAPKGSKSAGS